MPSRLLVQPIKLMWGTDDLKSHCKLFQPLVQDLLKDLHSELSGDFRNLVKAMLKSPAELDASELHDAMKASAQKKTETRK